MFKKITAIGTSALMIGMTLGVAAAAAFPAPFSGQSTTGVAVVTGTGSGVDDSVAAGSISDYLATKVSGSSAGTISGEGDSFKFEKPSTKFHLGDSMSTLYASIDDGELPNLLTDGKFVDNDNDEFDFTQKIAVDTGVTLTMFDDDEYRTNEPTIGFKISDDSTVLNYTLNFREKPIISDMVTADLTFMGKTYYVLSNSSSGVNKILTLLDSAESTILTQGETATVSGHEVSIEFLGSSTQVKLNVDGEVTNTLNAGETQKLLDGSYIGIKDILYDGKESGVSKIDFSIGNGKLKLTSAQDLQINDEAVSGMEVTITNDSTGDKMSSIRLTWKTNDVEFIATDMDMTMPGFEIVKLLFGGITYPVEETIEVSASSDVKMVLNNFPLKDSYGSYSKDIPLLYATTAGSWTGIGKSASGILRTPVDADTDKNYTMTFTSSSDDFFVTTWDDGNTGESYLMKANNWDTTGGDNVDFQYWKDGGWSSAEQSVLAGEDFTIGNADLKVFEVSESAKTVIIANNSVNTNFHTLYSKEGMKVYLPFLAANLTSASGAGSINLTATSTADTQAGHNNVTWDLVTWEEDKDDNVASGDQINVTIGWDSTPEASVTAITTTDGDATSAEIGTSDVWRDFTYSALATEILWDKPSGADSVKLIYHGSEVTADVYISNPGVTVSGVEAGSLLFKDNEKTSWTDRHVVLVGGSCVNSATAEVLGLAKDSCAADFTGTTNVGSGEYMIKTVGNAFTSGKVALVVAGYDKADTQAAASKLVNSPADVDTTPGKEYRGKTGVTGSLAFSEVNN